MAEDDINYTKKKYIHECTLPKDTEAIDELIPDDNYISKNILKLCLISRNVSYRRIYAKSTRVLDKERRAHLQHHYGLIHPFSDLSYYREVIMIIINIIQLTLAPVIIIKRLKMPYLHGIVFTTITIGNINIIMQFITGYYRYDIKQVVFDWKKIAKHYLKTFFIFDFIGNFPFRLILTCLDADISTIIVFKLALACNTGNFVKCMESLRQKRDSDLIIVRLLVCFAIAGIGLLWITALASLAANLDQRGAFRANFWWSVYIHFILVAGIGTKNQFVFVGHELTCKTMALIFGFTMRNIILVQLILFFKTYLVNGLKKARLFLEIHELCYWKKLPQHLRTKIFNYYEFTFQEVYYNQKDIFSILSESMRQNILDYDTKQWFDGDIFRLCPLVLRQLISINLDKEIFLKDDVIYTVTNSFTKIYYIKTGTVVLFDKDGTLAHIIDEGNFFSEKAIIFKEDVEMGLHKFKAVAYENCQLFSLKREVFLKLIKNFPDEYNVILDILTKRQQYLRKTKRISKPLKLADYYVNDGNSGK